MRYLAPVLLICVPFAEAQESRSTSRQFDANGNPVSASGITVNESRQGGHFTRTELMPTLNGGVAPRAKVEERVVRQDGTGKTIERVIRAYDQDGNPVPPQKMLIEERKHSDGSTSVITSTYRTDLNGNVSIAERAATTTSATSGNRSMSITQIARPAADGSLQLAERSTTTSETANGSSRESTVTHGRDANGNFYETARETRESTTVNGQTTENRAQYVEGQLAQQEVATSVTRPDGSVVTQVNIFAPQVRGVAGPAGGGLVLREQQTVESKKVGQTVIETVTSRTASVTDPSRLSEPRKVAETVCNGCQINNPAAKNQPKVQAPAAPPATTGAAKPAPAPAARVITAQ